jgi:ATP-dependent Clp protease ATP-binding subunit ClpA
MKSNAERIVQRATDAIVSTDWCESEDAFRDEVERIVREAVVAERRACARLVAKVDRAAVELVRAKRGNR